MLTKKKLIDVLKTRDNENILRFLQQNVIEDEIPSQRMLTYEEIQNAIYPTRHYQSYSEELYSKLYFCCKLTDAKKFLFDYRSTCNEAAVRNFVNHLKKKEVIEIKQKEENQLLYKYNKIMAEELPEKTNELIANMSVGLLKTVFRQNNIFNFLNPKNKKKILSKIVQQRYNNCIPWESLNVSEIITNLTCNQIIKLGAKIFFFKKSEYDIGEIKKQYQLWILANPTLVPQLVFANAWINRTDQRLKHLAKSKGICLNYACDLNERILISINRIAENFMLPMSYIKRNNIFAKLVNEYISAITNGKIIPSISINSNNFEKNMWELAETLETLPNISVPIFEEDKNE